MRVVILHGLNADPSAHWFPWLAETLRADGVEATVVALPDSSAPVRERWVDAARAAMGEPDGELVVVAHSLGSPTAIHALAGRAVRGLVLVAPLWERLPHLPEVDGFVTDLPDASTLVARTPTTVIASDGDPIVPPEVSLRLADALGASVVRVPSAGHFLGADGWTRLPAALEAVRALR